MSEKQQSGCPGLQRPSHNSKSQQKEDRIGLYNGKYASDFRKYLIMGQALQSVVVKLGLQKRYVQNEETTV